MAERHRQSVDRPRPAPIVSVRMADPSGLDLYNDIPRSNAGWFNLAVDKRTPDFGQLDRVHTRIVAAGGLAPEGAAVECHAGATPKLSNEEQARDASPEPG